MHLNLLPWYLIALCFLINILSLISGEEFNFNNKKLLREMFYCPNPANKPGQAITGALISHPFFASPPLRNWGFHKENG